MSKIALLFFLLCPPFAFAAAPHEDAGGPITCANGAPGGNDELLNSFRENVDPLKMAFLDSKRTTKMVTAEVCDPKDLPSKQLSSFEKIRNAMMFWKASEPQPQSSEGASFNLKTSNLQDAPDEVVSASTPLLIKRECIAAAMQRRAGREEYVCSFPKGKSGPHQQTLSKKEGIAGSSLSRRPAPAQKGKKPASVVVATNQAQCFSEDMVDYMHFAVNQALKCLSPEDPIDTRYILKKFNAETGFNFAVSWNGGRGLSQITSFASQELSNPKKGNGVYILEGLAKSKRPSCAPFKEIAAQDLASPQRIENDNMCDWVGPGDGLARNLIYGIGYHVHMRDKYVKTLLPDNLAKDKDVVNALTTMSFGREGIGGVRVLLKRNRVSAGTSAENLKAIINKRSAYVRENNNKQSELLCLQKNMAAGENASCKDMKFSNDELAGNTCVSKP